MTGSRTLGFLSSWWTTSAIVLCLAVSYMVFLFGDAAYTGWTGFVFHRPLGMILYVCLVMNILLATVRIITSGTKRPRITREAVREMDIYAEMPAARMDDLAAMMKQKGFTVTEDEDSLHAVKNRNSFLPGTVARAGIIVFLIAVFASAQMRKSSEMILHEGDAMAAFGSQLEIATVYSDLPESYLQLGEEGSFRPGAVRAEVRSGGSSRTITAGFPVRADGLYYRITHFGITLPVVLSGREVKLDLDILPPGRAETVRLPFEELTLTASLHPERTISKGLVTGKEYRLRNPFFHLVLQKGREKIGELNAREGETAAFPGISLSLLPHSLYVKVQAVSDPALPFIYAGVLLILLGSAAMSARFFWYAKELWAVLDGNTLHVGYREEYFRKWASEKFHSWIAKYESGNQAGS